MKITIGYEDKLYLMKEHRSPDDGVSCAFCDLHLLDNCSELCTTIEEIFDIDEVYFEEVKPNVSD